MLNKEDKNKDKIQYWPEEGSIELDIEDSRVLEVKLESEKSDFDSMYFERELVMSVGSECKSVR